MAVISVSAALREPAAMRCARTLRLSFPASPPLAVEGRWSELGFLAGCPVFTGAGNCINLLAQFAVACGAMWNHSLCIDGGQPANEEWAQRTGRRAGDDGSGDGPRPPEVEIETLVDEGK